MYVYTPASCPAHTIQNSQIDSASCRLSMFGKTTWSSIHSQHDNVMVSIVVIFRQVRVPVEAALGCLRAFMGCLLGSPAASW